MRAEEKVEGRMQRSNEGGFIVGGLRLVVNTNMSLYAFLFSLCFVLFSRWTLFWDYLHVYHWDLDVSVSERHIPLHLGLAAPILHSPTRLSYLVVKLLVLNNIYYTFF